jgi:hypothetical protein
MSRAHTVPHRRAEGKAHFSARAGVCVYLLAGVLFVRDAGAQGGGGGGGGRAGGGAPGGADLAGELLSVLTALA